MATIDAQGNFQGTGSIVPGGSSSPSTVPTTMQTTPATQTVTPAPQQVSPAAPSPTLTTPQVQPVQQAPQPSQQIQVQQPQQQPTQAPYTQNLPPTMIPQSNLAPGSTGQDVQALQAYLVQQGYLTPEQVSTGPGIYGPQTTAAVAAMQRDLGINAGTNAGFYGPQTQSALSQKYNSMLNSASGTAPQDAAGARSALQNMGNVQSAMSQDPVFGALATSMAPIMQSLTQVLQNINNPALTSVSLQQEYNALASQYNVPAVQAQMMNMTNVMNGTEQDIRDEIATSGGTATDSQVLAMTSARNRLIQKQYNSLATQYQAAVTNIQNQMQYATTDRQYQLQVQQASAGVAGQLASIEAQMVNMGLTMQGQARQAAQYNITQTGYQAFGQTLQDNPGMQSYYEGILGLAPGTFSDPSALSALDTYKQQSLALTSFQRAAQLYNVTGDPSYLQGIQMPSGNSFSGSGYTNDFISSLGQGASASMPLSQAVQSYGIPSLYQASSSAEGGSLPGVQNNPVNLKYASWMQQYGGMSSGVQATDGGTFASFPSQQDNMNAYGALVSNAAAGTSSAYGSNPTVGSFLSTYGGLAPTTYSAPMYGATGVNTDPMTPQNPNGLPQGPGTQAVASGLLLSPQSNLTPQSIQQATGLSLTEYSMLTGTNTNLFSRMPTGQKLNLTNQVNNWLNSHNSVDLSTFQSQYQGYQKSLTSMTQRLTNTQLAEKELQMLLPTLSAAANNANLGNVNVENVVKLAGGQQVNDASANEYMYYFKDLQNSLAYFYAAQRGNSSADDSDERSAAEVITGGLANGGIKGVQAGVDNTTGRIKIALGNQVDDITKNIWDLFGVGDQYKIPSQQMVNIVAPSGQRGTVPADQLPQALGQGASFANALQLTTFPGLGTY